MRDQTTFGGKAAAAQPTQQTTNEIGTMKPITSTVSRFLHIGLTTFAATGIVSGQVLINGSFETGIDPGITTELHAVDTTSIDGWTLQSGSIDYVGSSHWVAGDGSRSLDLNGISPGTIVQAISSLTPSQEYRVSFLMAANTEGGPAVKSLQASIGSFAQTFTFDGTGFSGANMGWSQRTFDFTATASTMTLAFSSLDSGRYGPALDALTLTPVPEPSSIALFAGALTTVVVFARRRLGQ